MNRISRKKARKQGYTIDDNCYPPLAYRGTRFQPKETRFTYTVLEEELFDKVKFLMNRLEEITDNVLMNRLKEVTESEPVHGNIRTVD